MAKGIHKGTELNNVRETWEQNEKNRENRDEPVSSNNELDQVVKEEAAEYDNDNKKNRLLGGDRATVNDENGNDESA